MPDTSPVPAAQPSTEREAERERARAVLARHAAYLAHNARRMADRAVKLGMAAGEVAALHHAGAIVGEAFGFEAPPPAPAQPEG